MSTPASALFTYRVALDNYATLCTVHKQTLIAAAKKAQSAEVSALSSLKDTARALARAVDSDDVHDDVYLLSGEGNEDAREEMYDDITSSLREQIEIDVDKALEFAEELVQIREATRG